MTDSLCECCEEPSAVLIDMDGVFVVEAPRGATPRSHVRHQRAGRRGAAANWARHLRWRTAMAPRALRDTTPRARGRRAA